MSSHSKQVSDDLAKVISYIKADSVSSEDKETITKQTLDYFDHYVSPGWLKYRKSVSTNSAVVEWKDQGAICEGLCGEEYIDCLGGFGIFTCGHRNQKFLIR